MTCNLIQVCHIKKQSEYCIRYLRIKVEEKRKHHHYYNELNVVIFARMLFACEDLKDRRACTFHEAFRAPNLTKNTMAVPKDGNKPATILLSV